ncbi:hypothetical protein ACHQM5_003647 [Ranunculus cassubicifolius]
MLKKDSANMSLISHPGETLIAWYWNSTSRLSRRRRGCTVRLGNRRRAMAFRSRPIVRLRVVADPFKRLKKILSRVALNGKLVDSFLLYFTSVYPSVFPFI